MFSMGVFLLATDVDSPSLTVLLHLIGTSVVLQSDTPKHGAMSIFP